MNKRHSWFSQTTCCTAALSILVSGCATGPQVTRLSKGEQGASGHVLYALPRAMVTVNLPVKISTFVGTHLTKEIPKDCTVEQRLKLNDACYWRFRTKDPGADGAILHCSDKKASYYLLPTESPVAISVPVPDPDQVYAVDLRAKGFAKLAVGLTLSQSGAPSALEYTATAPVIEQLRTVMGVGRSIGLFASATVSAEIRTQESRSSDLQKVVNALAVLEQNRLDLAKSPGATQASMDAISARQAALRALVEGVVLSTESTFSLAFDPPNLVESDERKVTLIPMVAAGGGQEILPCAPEKSSEWQLLLKPQAGSLVFAKANESHNKERDSTKADGFHYRVPLFTEAALQLGGTLETDTPIRVRIPVPVVIPQWGWVRALPRRLGIAAGAVASTLDPATGALIKVSSTADNTAGLEATQALLGEIAQRRATPPPPDEKAALERQVAICAARHRLGIPAEGDCAAFRPD